MNTAYVDTQPTHMYAPGSGWIKWAYVIVVLNAVVPIGLAQGSWVTMATGHTLTIVPVLGPLVLLVVGAWRVLQVLRTPGALDAPAPKGVGRALRMVALALLGAGAVFALLNLVSIPTGLLLASSVRGEAPVFFVAGVFLAVLGGIGVLGLILFELSRLVGFEQQMRGEMSRG